MSTIRSRFLDWLAAKGGRVTDSSGLLYGRIQADLDAGRSLSAVLAELERDGLIRREVRGRRTFMIELAAPPDVAREAVPDAPTDHGPDVDYRLPADALLAVAVKRSQAPVPSASPAPAVLDRMRQAEDTVDRLKAELEGALLRADKAEASMAQMQHNLDACLAELNRRPAGPTIADRLDDDDRRMLDQLMRSLPDAH